MSIPRVVALMAGKWQEHARFLGIYTQALLNTADNPFASVNAVRILSGSTIVVTAMRNKWEQSGSFWECDPYF